MTKACVNTSGTSTTKRASVLRLQLQLRDFGTIRERLTVAWDAGLVRLDHDWIGDDYLASMSAHFISKRLACAACPLQPPKQASSGRLGMSETRRKRKSRYYSITSSARASTVSGSFMFSIFAVPRLMMSFNLVGCSIGSSPGFMPPRMRAM